MKFVIIEHLPYPTKVLRTACQVTTGHLGSPAQTLYVWDGMYSSNTIWVLTSCGCTLALRWEPYSVTFIRFVHWTIMSLGHIIFTPVSRTTYQDSMQKNQGSLKKGQQTTARRKNTKSVWWIDKWIKHQTCGLVPSQHLLLSLVLEIPDDKLKVDVHLWSFEVMSLQKLFVNSWMC